eukprot:gene9138-16800_t
MAKHHPDLIFCRKQPGVAIGRLCEKCDGKCVICDSYVRPCTLVRICDECNYGSYQGRCVICGGPGVSDAYYCKECTVQEKDRDGCPKIVNLGSSKTDLFYERKKYGFKKRQEEILDDPVQTEIHLQYDIGTSGTHCIVKDVGTICYVVNEKIVMPPTLWKHADVLRRLLGKTLESFVSEQTKSPLVSMAQTEAIMTHVVCGGGTL